MHRGAVAAQPGGLGSGGGAAGVQMLVWDRFVGTPGCLLESRSCRVHRKGKLPERELPGSSQGAQEGKAVLASAQRQ